MTTTATVSPAWLAPEERETADALAALAGFSPIERARAVAEGRAALDTALVQRAGAAGLFGRVVGTDNLAATCVLAEQWGRALSPEPFVETNVVIGTLARSTAASDRPSGTEAILTALLAGREVATWASNDLPGYWGRADPVRAEASGSGFTLDGELAAVPHTDGAHWILLAARDGASVSHFLVPLGAQGVSVEARAGLDITRPRHTVRLDNVRLDNDALVGARGDALAEIVEQVQIAIPLALSQTIGAMRAIVDAAIAHARSRIAFGRPIGSFQAVKHMLVDASLGIEMSAAMRDAAVRAVGEARDAAEIVSMAKAFVGRTSIDVAHAAWQVFGGMAYMWENDFHLYLRRLTADAAFLGTEAWHNEHVVALHGRSN